MPTCIWQSAPDIRKKLQSLDGALGMPQPVDFTSKVYNAQEPRKIKQAIVFVETGWQNKRKRQDTKEKKRGPLDANQYVYCKKEGYWGKECPKFKK